LRCTGVCESAKPEGKRACQLLEALGGSETEVGFWDPDDEWRQEVLDIIEEIYLSAVSPTIDEKIVKGVSYVIKGYFTNGIQGGCRLSEGVVITCLISISLGCSCRNYSKWTSKEKEDKGKTRSIGLL